MICNVLSLRVFISKFRFHLCSISLLHIRLSCPSKTSYLLNSNLKPLTGDLACDEPTVKRVHWFPFNDKLLTAVYGSLRNKLTPTEFSTCL